MPVLRPITDGCIPLDARTISLLTTPIAPPIPRAKDTDTKWAAVAIEDAWADLRADIALALEDFTRRTGLTVIALNPTEAQGRYALAARIRIKTNR